MTRDEAPSIRTTAFDRRESLVSIAVLVLAVVALRIPVFGFVPDLLTDEQLYALIGHGMTDGLLPYVDLWDRKPIGLFAIFALADRLPFPSPQGYQIVAGIFTFSGAYLTCRIARQLTGPANAVGAGIIYIVGLAYFGSDSGQSEVFHVPLMLAMFALVALPQGKHFLLRSCIAMVVGGLALQVKYTVAPQCLLFGLIALWRLRLGGLSKCRLVGAAGLFGLLGLLPTIIVATNYWYLGHFEAFWFANAESNFLRHGLGRFRPGNLPTMLTVTLVALIGIWFSLRKRPDQTPMQRELTACTHLWLASAALTTLIPGTFYLYYLAAVVPPFILTILPMISSGGSIAAAAVVAGSLAILNPTKQWRESEAERPEIERLVQAIRPHVDATDKCLWVLDGRTDLYQRTGSCLPTRFIYPDHLNNRLERDSLPVSQLAEVRRILAGKPSVIVDADLGYTIRSDDVMELVRETLDRDYEPIAEARVTLRTLIVWKRKEPRLIKKDS